MLASKYAEPDSPEKQSPPKRTSPPAETKPLPPVPASEPAPSPKQHTPKPSQDKSPEPVKAHVPTLSRDEIVRREFVKLMESQEPASPRRASHAQKPSETVVAAPAPEADEQVIASPPDATQAVQPVVDPAPAAQPVNGPAQAPLDPAKLDARAQTVASTPDIHRRVQSPAVNANVKKITSKRGKPCVIRVPAEEADEGKRRRPWTLAEYATRLKDFERAGYSTKGFDQFQERDQTVSVGHEAQNRAIFPDPVEQTQDRQATRPAICIPDVKRWESYVNQMMEDKLKALGVAPAGEPAPQPAQSDTAMSQAAASPFQGMAGMATSPPPLSSSVNSQHHPFSAPFSPAAFTNNTSVGGPASPASSISNQMRPNHMSRQSTFGFPFPSASINQALQQPWTQGPGPHTPGQARGGTPVMSGPAQRMPSALSRASPDIFADQQQTPRLQNAVPHHGNALDVNDLRRMYNWSDESSLTDNPMERKPSQQSQTERQSNVNPGTFDKDAYGELAYPTPRGHQHNISENLEREAENAQYYPGEYVSADPARRPALHQAVASNVSNTSSTRLNVDAKEFKFNPESAHGRSLSMNKNPFAPTNGPGGTSSKTAVSLITAHANGETTGGSNFNVAAPTFKPPEQSNFGFSSAFKFQAKKPTPDPQPQDSKEGETPKKSTGGGIFGSINFADIIKPSRKSKAIPIVNPDALPKKAEEDEEEIQSDESGRITQGKGRWKRGKLAKDDGDDVPRFETPSHISAAQGPAATQPDKAEANKAAPLDTKDNLEDDDAGMSDFGIESPRRNKSQSKAQDELPSKEVAAAPKLAPASRPESTKQGSSPTLPDPARAAGAPTLPEIIRQTPVLDPTFQEIDAIMEHLDKEPNFGAEEEQQREKSPSVRKESLPNGLIDGPIPKLKEAKLSALQSQALPEPSKVAPEWLRDQNLRSSESPVRKLNASQEAPVSDWDDVLSSGEEAKFVPQAQFFDTRVKSLIEGILQQHLNPLQKSLKEMDTSVKAMSAISKEVPAKAVAVPHDKTDSDADDEDNVDDDKQPQPRSLRSDKKFDRMRAIVLDALKSSQSSQNVERLEIETKLRADAEKRAEDLQKLVDTSQNGQSTERLEAEISLRNEAEKRAEDLQKLLNLSEKEIALFKESSDKTEDKLQALRDERQAAQQRVGNLERIERELKARTSGLSAELSAAQSTLEEYRSSSNKWRQEIDSVKGVRESMASTIDSLKREAHQNHQAREVLGIKLEKLQDGLASTTRKLAEERELSRKHDEEQHKEHAVLNAKLEEELRTRQRLERELDRQGVHERNAIKATVTLEEVRNSNARLNAEVAKLREENLNERNAGAMHEREAMEAKDIARAEIMRTKTLLEAEIEVTKKRADNTKADLESRLEHVRAELDMVRNDNKAVREDHRQRMEEAHAARSVAVREASNSANAALKEERERFERQSSDMAKQHDVVLRNAMDQRERSEVHYNESLKLSNEKIVLLEDKIKHLEDKVTVAQSAAQAAATAAQQSSKAPAHASRDALRPSERVSPQALRESIVVLQEQLQEREGRIDKLEQELAKVDKEAPNKIRDRDTEIGWLRELLGVRVDDLSELVNLLSLDSYDRVAARDAAIRIKANLQMEQQEKERLLNGGARAPALPSLSDIQNFATPKAAQLAAAWGNWRKGGQSPSLSTLRDAMQATSSRDADGTPSKRPGTGSRVSSTSSTAQSFLSGLMTPPASNIRQRTPTPQHSTNDPKPLSLELGELDGTDVGFSPERSNGRPRTPQARSGKLEAPPVTPPLLRQASYDEDAAMSADTDELPHDEDEDEADTGAETAAKTELQPFGEIEAEA